MRAAQKRPRAWDKKMRAAREKMRPPFYHAEAARDTQGARLDLPLGIFFFGATKLNSLGATKLNSGAAKPNSDETNLHRK